MTRIQEIFKKVKSDNFSDLKLLVTGLFIVSLFYSFISVTLHNRFMTFGLDLGYFDEAVWKISQGIFPYSGVGCIWLLEDHFQPILYLLAPLYWFWSDVRLLLIFQSFLMVFASLPLYLLSKKISKNIIFSYACVFAYLFFIGTQFAILNEFHQVTIAPIFLGLLFYALEKKNTRLYIISLLGILVIKEDLSLLVAAVGFGLIFKREYRKWGIITLFVGIFFFIFLVYIFMPTISIKGVYSHLDFGEAGYTPVDILLRIVREPWFFIRSMVYPSIKLKTIFQSFFTFGFLPLFAPTVYLVPLLEDFVARFIYGGPQYTKWGLVNHHAATGAMLLAICAIYGAKNLKDKILKRSKIPVFTLLGLLMFVTTVLQDILFKAPIHSILKKEFYYEEAWVSDNREVISRVPKNVSVAAQNNLVPHLTHRESIYRIPYGLNSEYMVVDLSDGPNKYAPLTYSEMKEFVQNLLTTKRYSIVYQRGDAMLLKRNFKTDITKSKYYGDTKYCYYSFEER